MILMWATRVRRATKVAGAIALAGALGLGAVPGAAGAATRRATRSPSQSVDVVVAFYPLQWAVEQVAGPTARVRNLTPAGAEPHDLELSTTDLDAIEDSALVVVMGGGFQPALETAAAHHSRARLVVLDRLGLAADGDPHVWLDPVRMFRIVDEVRAALARVDPRHRAADARRATATRDRLAALDRDFASGLSVCDRRVIVTAHEAFGWMARRYHLRQEGVTGLAPDTEPDPRRLAELTDLVRATGTTTVFTEDLVSPKVAKALAREAHVRTAVLSPIEGRTAGQVRHHDDYVSLMRADLARLGRALRCG